MLKGARENCPIFPDNFFVIMYNQNHNFSIISLLQYKPREYKIFNNWFLSICLRREWLINLFFYDEYIILLVLCNKYIILSFLCNKFIILFILCNKFIILLVLCNKFIIFYHFYVTNKPPYNITVFFLSEQKKIDLSS